MAYRISLSATVLMSSLAFSALTAGAQALDASISGPANGTNVEPSAAIQKEIEGRSASYVRMEQAPPMIGSALAAGAPGVEGIPGTQSGR